MSLYRVVRLLEYTGPLEELTAALQRRGVKGRSPSWGGLVVITEALGEPYIIATQELLREIRREDEMDLVKTVEVTFFLEDGRRVKDLVLVPTTDWLLATMTEWVRRLYGPVQRVELTAAGAA